MIGFGASAVTDATKPLNSENHDIRSGYSFFAIMRIVMETYLLIAGYGVAWSLVIKESPKNRNEGKPTTLRSNSDPGG
jgi:hypothetical protein